MSDVNIDVGAALPFLWDQFLGLVGRDALSTEFRNELESRLRTALREAATVQVIGMDRPLSLKSVYQPTRVTGMGKSASPEDLWDHIERGIDSIVFGLPGYGKTTLFRHVFSELTSRGNCLPILYTLRRPGTPAEIVRFVQRLKSDTATVKRLRKKGRIILLLDGFDEVVPDERAEIIEALRQFRALEVGPFFVTARLFYDLDELHAFHLQIAPFNDIDIIKFIESFGRGYGHHIDAMLLLHELKTHGFYDLATHPLLLALICIVRTGPNPILPRTTIGLIKRAIFTLTLRWDASKQIARPTDIPIDGEGRVECMMRVAYAMSDLDAPETVVFRAVREHLALAQHRTVNPERLLLELAQWYGLLVPIDDDRWSFVHKTIHDYLAARYWVESGQFEPTKVEDWNARAAYAACISHNATSAMISMLRDHRSMYAFSECLYNAASFHTATVATAVVRHFRLVGEFLIAKDTDSCHCKTRRDFFDLAGPEFLVALADAGLNDASNVGDFVLSFALNEISKRQIPVAERTIREAVRRLGRSVTVESEGRGSETCVLENIVTIAET